MADKPKKGKKQEGRWELYKSLPNPNALKKRFCPKCGEGTLMGQHKDRCTCGKCGYMEKRGA